MTEMAAETTPPTETAPPPEPAGRPDARPKRRRKTAGPDAVAADDREYAEWKKANGKPGIAPPLEARRRHMWDQYRATQGHRPPEGGRRRNQVKGANRTVRT